MDRYSAQDEKAAAESRLARRRQRVEERRAEVRRFAPALDSAYDQADEWLVVDNETGCYVAGPFESFAEASDTADHMEETA